MNGGSEGGGSEGSYLLLPGAARALRRMEGDFMQRSPSVSAFWPQPEVLGGLASLPLPRCQTPMLPLPLPQGQGSAWICSLTPVSGGFQGFSRTCSYRSVWGPGG